MCSLSCTKKWTLQLKDVKPDVHFYCEVKSNYSSNFTQNNSECICSKSEHGQNLNLSSSLTILFSQKSLLLIRSSILKNLKKYHTTVKSIHFITCQFCFECYSYCKNVIICLPCLELMALMPRKSHPRFCLYISLLFQTLQK